MEDADISLKVARIMWPVHEWEWSESFGGCITPDTTWVFDYRTDDALGKMAVWLTNYMPAGERYDPVMRSQLVCSCLQTKNPHMALANAIIVKGEK